MSRIVEYLADKLGLIDKWQEAGKNKVIAEISLIDRRLAGRCMDNGVRMTACCAIEKLKHYLQGAVSEDDIYKTIVEQESKYEEVEQFTGGGKEVIDRLDTTTAKATNEPTVFEKPIEADVVIDAESDNNKEKKLEEAIDAAMIDGRISRFGCRAVAKGYATLNLKDILKSLKEELEDMDPLVDDPQFEDAIRGSICLVNGYIEQFTQETTDE